MQPTTRRDLLRLGSLGVLGLALPDLGRVPFAAGGDALTPGLSGAVFGKAKHIIFLWLQGGPPQHETFDPKPLAPLEIRGEFKPIQTNVPGIHFCELLPRTAQRADKLAVIRSLYTDDNNHDVSGYWVLTGYPYGPGSARQIKPTDWPYFGSVVKMLKPSEQLPALTSVWLPDMMRLNDNVTPAGQTAGFLGPAWDPERFVGDPSLGNYRIEGLELPGHLSADRMHHRKELLTQLGTRLQTPGGGAASDNWHALSSSALDLVTAGKAKAAFELSQEADSLRDRYGRHAWGQSCLLARRLVEAGVRLVHVNWPREPGDNAVDNPMWDTHAQNADRLQDALCPIFDVTFAALLDDLADRGLLEETLVVAIGEFGRTPQINSVGGRDHWGAVFSCVLAGAGIAGGQVFGASDKHGAYPAANPIRPHDLTATMYHLLGIPHEGAFLDKSNRPQRLTHGQPLHTLMGNTPATLARCASTADLQLVPPFDSSLLLDTEFAQLPLVPATPPSRAKGWRASPTATGDAFGLAVSRAATPTPHARICLRGAAEPTPAGANQPVAVAVPAESVAMLAQEIRNARGGSYAFTVRISGAATSGQVYQQAVSQGLDCQLMLFRFRDMKKNPLEADLLAVQAFQPRLTEFAQPAEYAVSAFLGSMSPGANFSIGMGLGVGLRVRSKSDITLGPGEFAELQLHSASLEFNPRPRNDDVTV